jgi:putative acetyltransferase
MTHDVEIRHERPEDRADLRRVNELAFAEPDEADIVDAIRAAGAATLSLVASVGGAIAGHILFSPVSVASARETFAAIGLGPMAVLPAHQRAGVGSRLVARGLAELRALGHEIVVVLGHPSYYPRFGFVTASSLGLRWERDARDDAFMVLELTPGALRCRGGVVRYRPELAPG